MERIREDSTEASSLETKFETHTFPQTPIKKKNSSTNARRFSDEQIRLLESIFMSESTKLEPMKKLQLARELGLQPRQVAIWFQNKRARWKSKQIEQDYAKLKANYDCLASRFESLKKEKDSLLAELQKLNEQMEKADDLRRVLSYKNEHEASKLRLMEEGLENKGSMHLQEKNNINSFEGHCGCEAQEFLSIELIKNDSLTSSEKWFGGSDDGGGDLNSGGLLDPSTSFGSQWLNFWPV